MKKQRRKGSNAREVWESLYGKVGEGRLIHHIDGNPGNDDISNLACVSKKEHGSLHKATGTYRNGSQTMSRVYGTEPNDFVWAITRNPPRGRS